MMTLSNVKITSLNVNGLGDLSKRNAMITHIDSISPDICCLVDTRLSPDKSRIMDNESDSYKWWHNSGLQINDWMSRGVSIGVKKSSMIKPDRFEIIIDGNVACLSFSFEEKSFVLYCLYGPSDCDNPAFFEKVFDNMALRQETYKLLGGDFNIALSHTLDTHNYNNVSRPQARKKIMDKMLDCGLSDIFRVKFPQKRQYTWHSANGSKRSRLDFFLISNNLKSAVSGVSIGTAFMSDHKNIILEIDFSGVKKGTKKWRYTPEMREDVILQNLIKDELYRTVFRYLSEGGENDQNNRGDEELWINFRNSPENLVAEHNISISWGALLEVLLNDTKNQIISYTSAVVSNEKSEISRLRNELILAQQDPINYTQEEIQVIEARYEELVSVNTSKRLIRRQEAFKIEGERPSAFFLNLEKNVSSDKYIPRLKVGNEWVTSQEGIENEIRSYYRDLYKNHDHLRSESTIEDFIKNEGLEIAPKLTAGEAGRIDGLITLKELSETLKKTKDRSSPGLTGFAYTFFKDFWKFLGPILVKVFNEAHTLGKLPDFMSRGVIQLLPKGNKDRTLLTNWRPITLIECAYKIFSGAIAARLNSVINKLVDGVQKGFVPGRNIAENVRVLYDTLHYAKINQKGGTAIVLDYAKAFDSISHTYFMEVLDFFGFGEGMKKWIKICLNNFFAQTSHADNLSSKFKVGRGARQGDPLSPPLFALAIEIFSIRIRSDKNIIPFELGPLTLKLNLYADDSILFTIQDENSVKSILRAVNEFFGLSGLKIQLPKCTIVNFGVPGPVLCPEINIGRKDEFEYLGLLVDPFLERLDQNITIIMKDLVQLSKTWQYRFLTPLGRNVIAKSLFIPKICHIVSVVPQLDKKILDKFEDLIYDFIWGGKEKRRAFARKDAQVLTYDGGLNMPNMKVIVECFLISWLRRAAFNHEQNIWRDWLDILMDKAAKIKFDDLLLAGEHKWKKVINGMTNPFWESVFKAYHKLICIYLSKFPGDLAFAPIWNTAYFKHNNRSFNPEADANQDFARVCNSPMDMIGDDGKIRGKDSLELRFACAFPPFLYEAIQQKIDSINPLEYSKARYKNGSFSPRNLPLNVKILTQYKKGCSHWNKIMRKQRTDNIRRLEDKVTTSLEVNIEPTTWKRAYGRVSNIQYGNNIKWMNHQILRGCLTTNYLLCKMRILNSNLCTFCKSEPETIKHLLWDCPWSRDYLNAFQTRMQALNIDFDIGFNPLNAYGREIFFFGDETQGNTQIVNYLADQAKRYIWISRCNDKKPSLAAGMNSLKNAIRIDKSLARVKKNHDFLVTLADRMGIG